MRNPQLSHKVVARFVRAGTVVVIVLGIVLIAIHRDDESWKEPAREATSAQLHPHGGSVRVGVSTPPEWSDGGDGGDTLRQLTLPKLFVAQPDGSWAPSLVQPGTDHVVSDGRSASFKLRRATWSDGTPVTVDDLRRTADSTFVASIHEKSGKITVDFTQYFPGWRQLWSGADSITPATPGLTAGPYRVQTVTSGLETVLTRNNDWYGSGKVQTPFLDEIRLTVVPDAVTERQLFAQGSLDVVSPAVDAGRTQKLRDVPGSDVDVAPKGGKWVALRLNDRKLGESTRATIARSFPRTQFTAGVLADDARAFNGFGSSVWPEYGPPGTPLNGTTVALTLPGEEPIASTFDKAFAFAVTSNGGKETLSSTSIANVDTVKDEYSYDVLMVHGWTAPDLCWSCMFGDVDADLARKADTGDKASQTKLQTEARDRNVFVPLWIEKTVTASRSSAVRGVEANGFAVGDAWNAETWWKS